jgi:hypothetical protein
VSSRVAATLGSAGALRVLTNDDLRALLSAEAAKQLVGCDKDASCLAEIADAAGARLLVAPAAAKEGAGTALTLSLMDTRSAESVQRVEVRGADAAALVSSVAPAAARLRSAALTRLGVVVSDDVSFEAWRARRR